MQNLAWLMLVGWVTCDTMWMFGLFLMHVWSSLKESLATRHTVHLCIACHCGDDTMIVIAHDHLIYKHVQKNT